MKWTFFLAIQFWMLVQLAAQDARNGNDRKSKISSDSLLNIGQMILRAREIGKEDTSAADKIFRMAINKALNANDFYSAGKVYYEIGEMYFHHRNHNKSFGAFFNAKEYFTKTGSEKEIGFTNFKLGRQQFYRGNYKLSVAHLRYAMQTAKQLKLKNLESDVLEYLGVLYHVMPDPGYQSSGLLKKSLQIKQQLGDQIGRLRIFEKLAGIYYDQKKFDSALFYSNSSVGLAEKLGLKYDVHLSLLNQIPALLRLNKPMEAKEKLYFIKTHALNSFDLNMRIRYYIQAGNYNMAMQDETAGQNKFDTALQIAQKSGFPEMYALVYKNMAGASYYNNDFKKAYEYQLQYADQMASLYSKENFTTFKELEFIFKTNITEDEVKYLNIQNKNERILRTVFLAGAALFLLLAGVIFYLYRKQKNKNLVIKKQATDLQTLMQEIHHRVKNNLQIISSLLDLQSIIIKDDQVAQAIKEGRNRVQSMALIHQYLYNERNVKGIAIDEYINNLAQSLFDSYNVQPGQVQLKMDIEKLDLDVDTAIPIGLMLNELISNSLKYAFENSEGGRIEVALKKSNGILLLQVKDNGKGFPETADPAHSTSFGMRMIKIFAQKMKADLDIYNDQGACITMRIRKYKMAG